MILAGWTVDSTDEFERGTFAISTAGVVVGESQDLSGIGSRDDDGFTRI